MGIENLLAQGVQIRPAGMERNALMQAQEFKDRQQRNALMQMQMQGAMEQQAQARQAAQQNADWRNALQVPQGQEYVQPGRPAMNAAQAESAVGNPGYGMSSAQDQMRTMPADPRMVQAVQMAKAGQMSPMDLFKIQNPEQETASAAAGSMIYDKRTGKQIAQVPDKAATDTSDWKDYQKIRAEGFTGTYLDYQTKMANLKSPKTTLSVNTDSLGLKPKDRFEMEGKLADDYKGVVKLDNLVLSATSKIKTALGQKGALKDQAAIYSFAKMLDPEGAVREADYAAIANTTGLVDRVRGYLNRLLTGEQLNDTQRSEMVTLMTAFEGVANQRLAKAQADFSAQASRYNLRPESVFGARPQQAQAAKAGGVVNFADLK